MVYDFFDRFYISGIILMGISIFLVLVVVLSNIGLYANISTDLQGSNGGILLVTSLAIFIVGSLFYYAGKGGISESKVVEDKLQSERDELLSLRKKVQELEDET